MEFVKKIAIIGEGGVGKTTLMYRYINGTFLDKINMTIGSDFFTKVIRKKDIQGKLLIWDLGGQDRFRPMMKGYLSGAEAIILAYDLTRLMTLAKIHDWIEILKKASVPIDGSVPIVLVGMKKDLYRPEKGEDEKRKEFIEEIKDVCSIALHMETSSVTNENIDDCFNFLIRGFIRQVLSKNIESEQLIDHIEQKYN